MHPSVSPIWYLSSFLLHDVIHPIHTRHAYGWGTTHNGHSGGGRQGESTASTAQLLSESIIEVKEQLVLLFSSGLSRSAELCCSLGLYVVCM